MHTASKKRTRAVQYCLAALDSSLTRTWVGFYTSKLLYPMTLGMCNMMPACVTGFGSSLCKNYDSMLYRMQKKCIEGHIEVGA